jgi:hypothetical protein
MDTGLDLATIAAVRAVRPRRRRLVAPKPPRRRDRGARLRTPPGFAGMFAGMVDAIEPARRHPGSPMLLAER